MDIALTGLVVADSTESWRAAGFSAAPDVTVGSVRIALVGRGSGTGIMAWSFEGLRDDIAHIDGVLVEPPHDGPVDTVAHPNGVVGIDHVVLMTPDLERTQKALAEVGPEPRRVRDAEMFGRPIRQVFYRLGDVILEVIGEPAATGDGPSSLWGITFTVADLEATAARLGDGLGTIKEAVQPGRRIATLRGRQFDISVPVAFISRKT